MSFKFKLTGMDSLAKAIDKLKDPDYIESMLMDNCERLASETECPSHKKHPVVDRQKKEISYCCDELKDLFNAQLKS